MKAETSVYESLFNIGNLLESFICSAFVRKTPFTQELNQQNFTGLMSPSIAYKELDRLMSILTKETYQSSAKR